MASIHQGVCGDCEASRAALRVAARALQDLKAAGERGAVALDAVLDQLARAPAGRIDAFLEDSIHERETWPRLPSDTEPPPVSPPTDRPSSGESLSLASLRALAEAAAFDLPVPEEKAAQ